jgi:ribonuclease D
VSSDSPQDIDKVEGLSSPWLRRQKDTFLHLLKLAHNAPRDTWPSREGRPRLTPGEEQMMKAMQNAVKACAEELNISATMLATRRDLDSMLRGSTETRIHRGWRRTVVLQRLESSMQAPS